jgi:hypothetical protein
LIAACIALAFFAGDASATKITPEQVIAICGDKLQAAACQEHTHLDASKNAAPKFARLIAAMGPSAARKAATVMWLPNVRFPRPFLNS